MSDVAKLVEMITARANNLGDESDLALVESLAHRRPEPPEFDVLPRESLAYAEIELGQDDLRSRINCISHLKHALECQIDIFLHAWCMWEYAQKRNLKLHAKIKHLTKLWLFNARSATRLNLVRNKVEHEHARPNIQDLGAFYDLVALLIASLERAVAGVYEVQFTVPEGMLSVVYSDIEPRIICGFEMRVIRDGEFKWDESVFIKKVVEASLDDDEELFIQLFRILSLLGDHSVYVINTDTLLTRLALIAKASDSPK